MPTLSSISMYIFHSSKNIYVYFSIYKTLSPTLSKNNLISYMLFIFVYFVEMLNLSFKIRTCPNFPLYMLHLKYTFLYTKTRPQVLELAEPTPFYNVILHITIYNIFIKSTYFHIYIDTHNPPPRFHLKKKHKKIIQEWNGMEA